MALSDEELRTLEQLEAALVQDDPKLASALRGGPRMVVSRRGAMLGTVGFLAGLTLLVLGVSTFFLISVAGYAMMLVGTLALLGSISRVHNEGPARERPIPPRPDLANHDFVAMMEKQWRRQHPNDAD